MKAARTRTWFLGALVLLVGGGLVAGFWFASSVRSNAETQPQRIEAATVPERVELVVPRRAPSEPARELPGAATGPGRRPVELFGEEFYAEIDILVLDGSTGATVGDGSIRVQSWPFFGEDSEVFLTDRTDASGRASLRVPLGRVEVIALDDSVPIPRFAVVGAEVVEPGSTKLTLVLEGSRELRGVVVDAQLGTPIPGAVVSNDFLDSILGAPTVTDERGRFSLVPWPTGMEAGVNVTAEGYGQEAARIRVEPDGSWTCPARLDAPAREGADSPFIEVRLTPQRVIAGVLVDGSSSRPIEGGWARAEGMLLVSKRFGRVDEASATTDSAGAFTLDRLRPEPTHTVWAGARGFAPRRILVESGDLHVDLGRLALRPGAFIAGRVIDTRGDPVGGVSIRVRTFDSSRRPTDRVPRKDTDERRDGSSRPRPFTHEARTGPDGSFKIGGLPGGDVKVEARAAGFSLAHREVVLQAGRRTSLLEPLVVDGDMWAVSGEVLGGPGRPDSIVLRLSDPRLGSISESSVDARGRFRIWGLKPGRVYALQVSRDATVLWQSPSRTDHSGSNSECASSEGCRYDHLGWR